MTKIIRTSTVPLSLNLLLKGQLSFLNQHFEVVAIAGEGDDLRTVEVREKVRVIPIEMVRTISPIKDLKSLWKLYLCFKRERPDIVHSITPKAGLLSMTAAYLAGVPIRMHTFTGLIFPSKQGLFKRILIMMDKLLCKFATNIYPEGEGVRRELLANKITSKNLQVLANGNVNGVDLSHYILDNSILSAVPRLRHELNIFDDDFVFVFVGRLVGDKGVNELVTAFKGLTNYSERVKLILVGPLESDLDALSPDVLVEIEKNPCIVAVGYQTDVRQYYAISDAFVLPSYREGFPNVVMQAGAMGLPSIVSNINGCNEIIIEGENGIIIPPKDSKALFNAMRRFITDKDLVAKLRSNARRMIVERYEQQVVWDAILAEYKRLEKDVQEGNKKTY